MSQSGDGDHGREEFLAEAQEIIDTLSRDLLLLDDAQRRGERYVETLNDLFRGVHTLKGLSGMFGFDALAGLAHVLEDLLEDLRLGRVELQGPVLDVLFEGVEAFGRALTQSAGSAQASQALAARVAALCPVPAAAQDVLEQYALDPSMLAVLTEYEEHRLRTSLEQGLTVYRVRVHFALDSIDTALEALKERVKQRAEIITYLPSMDGGGGDAIEIEMLMATGGTLDALRAAVDRKDAVFVIVTRREHAFVPQRNASVRPAASSSVIPGASHRPAMDPGASDLSLRSLANVVRVDIRKLDHLMNVTGELGTVRAAFGRWLDRVRGQLPPALVAEAQRLQRSFGRHVASVQDGVLDIRMVPLSQLFDKVAVVVRQLARDQHKEVGLLVTGSETEVDKLIAEELADPLMHLVRNAIDHGIEPASARAELRKPSRATLAINAYHKGSHVVIELSDDGRGIDPQAVAETVVRKGLLSPDALADFSREDLLDVVFLPGFSTATAITDVSGRGVGMDVVRTNITRLGGAVELDTELGVGTKVTITLPITLAIIKALLFEVRGRTLALPLTVVREALRLPPGAVRTIEGRQAMSLRGSTLPLCRLGDLFRFSEGAQDSTEEFVIVVTLGQRRLGLVVDRLVGQQDIVVKGLGPSLSQVQGVTGAADLGDHRLVLVLDAAAIVDEVLVGRAVQVGLGGVQ